MARDSPPAFELTAPVAAKAPPRGPDWIHEIEHDGRRAAAVIAGGTVRLLTRGHRDVTRRFHVIATDLLALKERDAVIDGEIATLDEAGIAKSDALRRAIEAGARERLVYFAFDLLFLDGMDLRVQPLLARKDRLRELLRPLVGTRILYGEYMQGDPGPIYARLREMGAHVIVSKAATAPYRGGRDPSWLKVKLRAWQSRNANAGGRRTLKGRY